MGVGDKRLFLWRQNSRRCAGDYVQWGAQEKQVRTRACYALESDSAPSPPARHYQAEGSNVLKSLALPFQEPSHRERDLR